MRTKAILSILLLTLLVATACGGGSASSSEPAATRSTINNTTSDNCGVSEYKSEATAQMDRFRALANSVDLDSAESSARGRDRANALLTDIRGMRCKDAFPLKQETLEYTVIHFRNALQNRVDGNLIEMNSDLDKAILNQQQFNDWSVDMR